MNYSRVTQVAVRRRFDPSKKADLQELKYFLDHSKWRNGCPFYMEYPWAEIPAMCKDRYATFMLQKNKSP